jgi:hypothetical protein
MFFHCKVHTVFFVVPVSSVRIMTGSSERDLDLPQASSKARSTSA